MGIVRIPNPNIIQWGVSGNTTISITDNTASVLVSETDGFTLEFSKDSFSYISDPDGIIIIGDCAQTLEFPYISAGYASVSAAMTALNVMKQNLPAGTITYPTGTETITASTVTSSGSVTAGKKSVAFQTNSAFAGTIAGVTVLPNEIYNFSVASPGSTLAAIPYTVTAGSMNIFVST